MDAHAGEYCVSASGEMYVNILMDFVENIKQCFALSFPLSYCFGMSSEYLFYLYQSCLYLTQEIFLRRHGNLVCGKG